MLPFYTFLTACGARALGGGGGAATGDNSFGGVGVDGSGAGGAMCKFDRTPVVAGLKRTYNAVAKERPAPWPVTSDPPNRPILRIGRSRPRCFVLTLVSE
jgi:hypothetical protein